MRIAIAVGVLVSLGSAAPARADATADVPAVKQAFGAFVDGVSKKQIGKLDLFVAPAANDTPLPEAEALAETAAMIPKPKVTYVSVVVSPGGKSAWLAADLAADVKIDGKSKYKKLRASAMLVLDGSAWRVASTLWSAEVKDRTTNMCGMFDGWNTDTHVPKAIAPTVDQVIAGFDEDVNSPKLRAMFSDDKRALLLGSAPKEKFVGGASIKKLFASWPVFYGGDGEGAEADKLAGASPDGELMWMAIPVNVHKFCTTYRAFYVLAKEKAGWRIIHQHYSNRSL